MECLEKFLPLKGLQKAAHARKPVSIMSMGGLNPVLRASEIDRISCRRIAQFTLRSSGIQEVVGL
jgi:hypothetical protein